MPNVSLTVSSDGSGDGTVTSETVVRGWVEWVQLAYSGADSGITVDLDTVSEMPTVILNGVTGNTDTTLHPHTPVHSADGTAQAAYGKMYLDGEKLALTVAGAGADNVDVVTATLKYVPI